MAYRKYDKWTEYDEMRLKRFLKNEIPIRKIASHLGRSISHVRYRINLLRRREKSDERKNKIVEQYDNYELVYLPTDPPKKNEKRKDDAKPVFNFIPRVNDVSDYYQCMPKRGFFRSIMDVMNVKLLSSGEKRWLHGIKKRELAKHLHDTYNELSRKLSWDVNPKCKTEFDDLPSENRNVMLGVADNLLKNVNKINRHRYVIK